MLLGDLEALLSTYDRYLADTKWSLKEHYTENPSVPPTPIHHVRAFLCHSSADKLAVRQLYERLLPGHDWDLDIRRAVRDSHVVIVCLSTRAVNKAGYLQKEMRFVLDRADEQPGGTIFVIPLKLEECVIPERLSRWQWVNLFEEDSYELLIRSLQYRAEQLGFVRK